jgi:hypothetical protein
MFRAEPYFQIAKQRNKEMIRDAGQRRLLRSSPRPTRLSWRIRRLLHQLGSWLIRASLPPQRTDCCQPERLAL